MTKQLTDLNKALRVNQGVHSLSRIYAMGENQSLDNEIIKP